MGIDAIYSIFCDDPDAGGEWVAQEEGRQDAKRVARKRGWVRRRLPDGRVGWVCPPHRLDVCGESYQQETWCLLPPDHEEPHSWLG